MKKRYMIAAAAALAGGGLLVEMQVGSKGLDLIELAAAGGGGPAGGALTGSADAAVTVRAAARPKAPRLPAPAAIEPVEEPALLASAADDLVMLRANSGIWGDNATINAVLLPGGFADISAPEPGAIAGAGPDLGRSYPLAGAINRASGADALAAALRQPLAASTVPEPATWLSLIVGLAMIGFNLRRRQGRRSVAS